MLKIQCVSFLVLLMLFGCDNKETSTKQIGRRQYIISTYEKGKLLSEEQYTRINGKEILNGYSKYYYDNGQVECQFYFKMGVWDSISNCYFRDGTLASEYNRWEGKPMGKQVSYYHNGNPRDITLSNGIDTTKFYIKLAEDGTIISYGGTPMIAHASKTVFTKSDTLYLSHLVIEEKNLKTKLRMKIINPLGKVTRDTTILNFHAVGLNHFYYYRSYFKSTGKYQFQSFVELTGKNGRTIYGAITDTMTVVE